MIASMEKGASPSILNSSTIEELNDSNLDHGIPYPCPLA